jgi:hypothetical protein
MGDKSLLLIGAGIYPARSGTFSTHPSGTVEQVVLGVQKLAFAIFRNLDVVVYQLLNFLQTPHQQAGALRFGVFQHALKVVATKSNERNF